MRVISYSIVLHNMQAMVLLMPGRLLVPGLRDDAQAHGRLFTEPGEAEAQACDVLHHTTVCNAKPHATVLYHGMQYDLVHYDVNLYTICDHDAGVQATLYAGSP